MSESFFSTREEWLKHLAGRVQAKTRNELLRELHDRMETNHILFPDVWSKLLLTETKVLREICASEFEREVFERVRPSRNL